MTRYAKPRRGPRLFDVRVQQARRERARVRARSPPATTGAAAVKIRRRVEIGHLAVDLDVRQRQLVAKPEVEGQLRALLPVVLDVGVERVLAQMRRCRRPAASPAAAAPSRKSAKSAPVWPAIGEPAGGVEPGEGVSCRARSSCSRCWRGRADSRRRCAPDACRSGATQT